MQYVMLEGNKNSLSQLLTDGVWVKLFSESDLFVLSKLRHFTYSLRSRSNVVRVLTVRISPAINNHYLIDFKLPDVSDKT